MGRGLSHGLLYRFLPLVPIRRCVGIDLLGRVSEFVDRTFCLVMYFSFLYWVVVEYLDFWGPHWKDSNLRKHVLRRVYSHSCLIRYYSVPFATDLVNSSWAVRPCRRLSEDFIVVLLLGYPFLVLRGIWVVRV